MNNLLIGFFRLIRAPNLVFIIVTQVLFYFLIVIPAHQQHDNEPPHLNTASFFLLVGASVLIAAAGYIINDYFDLNIDRVNKPDQLVIGQWVSRRWAMVWHFLLSGMGLMMTAYVSAETKNGLLLLANGATVILLWVYSTTYKKKILSGNVIISLLTAWVVGVIFVADTEWRYNGLLPIRKKSMVDLYTAAVFYAGFAFLVSMIREIVKDLEDQEGDRRYGCTTVPIAWGVFTTKVIVAVLLAVLTILLVLVCLYSLISGWFAIPIYGFLLMLIPVFKVGNRLKSAQTASDFGALSRSIKFIMLWGILSMVLYNYYLV
ncbi:MAG: ubiquinone biosynthesis protein UbiA [Bacteroidetes bacterium]|nr:ubiquinone biosynthesis protein UbiA [Bacteroidota bacterium]